MTDSGAGGERAAVCGSHCAAPVARCARRHKRAHRQIFRQTSRLPRPSPARTHATARAPTPPPTNALRHCPLLRTYPTPPTAHRFPRYVLFLLLLHLHLRLPLNSVTIPVTTDSSVVSPDDRRPLSPVSATKPAHHSLLSAKCARHARPQLVASPHHHSAVTHASVMLHLPRRQPPMTDANYPRSPTPRTSSLADLVHRTETAPVLHPHLSSRPPAPDSDNGSQQERNHQRPSAHPANLPVLPPPAAADSSPKHNPRKRRASHLLPAIPAAPDISSLTQKPDDHASSVALPHVRDHFRVSPPLVDDRRPEKFQRTVQHVEGSTDMLPIPSALNNAEQHSPSKSKRRSLPKDSRTELLEENRTLRIDLEHVKSKLRSAESHIKKMRKDVAKKEALLLKYRSQLVHLFESGGDPRLSLRMDDDRAHRREERSKMDAESMSNSAPDDEWSAYSPSASFEREPSEEHRRAQDRDVMSRSEGARKHRRTRAPAWTAREEEIFMKAYHKHGCQWKLYQNSLPGRSRRQIQSHGSYLIRQGKLAKKNSRPWQRRKGRDDGAPSSTVKDGDEETQGGRRSDEE